jgi:hypothetical protein
VVYTRCWATTVQQVCCATAVTGQRLSNWHVFLQQANSEIRYSNRGGIHVQSWATDGNPTSRQADRLIVGRNLTSTSSVSGKYDSCGCNWATLFLGDINKGTWPSNLGESEISDNKIWSWVLQESDPRMSVLERPSNSYKLQTHPLIREGAPYQEPVSSPTVIRIWPWALDGCLIPRQTGRLIDWSTDRRS